MVALDSGFTGEGQGKDLERCVAECAKGSTDLSLLLETVSHAARTLVGADRATIFVHDQEKKELKTFVGHGLKGVITLKLGQGFVGYSAEHSKILNIPDAYKSSMFNPDTDVKTGYRTNSVLCLPLYDNFRQCLGVLQLINKLPKGLVGDAKKAEEYIHAPRTTKLSFSDRDQEVAVAFASLAGLALERNFLWSDRHWGIHG